jgi:uncharacterized protein (DUF58 family)
MSNNTALDTLEPRGTHTQLRDLLRWQLAAAYIPLENRRNSSQLVGSRRSTLRGRGIDFDEVRLYQTGDDVRAIDWRVTARTGKAHTKIFHEEKERPVIVVVDLRSTMYFGSRRCFKSVLAAHAAALLAWATLQAGDRIGAVLISDSGIIDIKPKRSRHTLLQIFQKIIEIDRQLTSQLSTNIQAPHWQNAMQQLRTVVRPGSCVVMLSDFHDWNTECEKALHPVVRHSQCFALSVDDNLEKQLPAIGLVSLRMGLRKAIVDTQNTKLLERFQQQQTTQREAFARTMQSLRVPTLALNTHQPLFTALQLFFAGKYQNLRHEQ